MPRLTISVVICTCNRYESIVPTLNTIVENSESPIEILVIDQSDDKDRSRAIVASVESPLIRLIQVESKGQSIARNCGIQNSSGEIIAFTDDDAYVDPGWIRATRDTFEQGGAKVGVAGGKIIPVYEQRNPDWSIPEKWEFILPAYDQPGGFGRYTKGYPPGVNYSIRRSLTKTVGFFDEQMGLIDGRKRQIFGDDTDYSVRTLRSGYELIFNPESIVYHPVPLTRQTQEFLNSRLYAKGLTEVVVESRQQVLGRRAIVARLVQTFWGQLRNLVGIRKGRVVREGQQSLLRGRARMLLVLLKNRNVFETGFF